jgi:photosystem II stability/assembly factor-like uncharacterized protein
LKCVYNFAAEFPQEIAMTIINRNRAQTLRANLHTVLFAILGVFIACAHQNAVASVADSGPVVGAMSFNPASVRPGGSFSATFSGTNLTDQTYFDVRFQVPGTISFADRIALNWQQGTSAVHSVAPDTIPGIWQITGVSAHADSSDHTAPFTPISVALTVSSLTVTKLDFDQSSVHSDSSFSATFSGINLSADTYFDVRFRPPCSDKDQVALNWQRGISATHHVPAEMPIGIWTINGVWAHQDINDHSTDFASNSTALVVSPQNAVPFTGKVTSIVVDPSRSATVYAGTIGSGIYKTCDGGQNWFASGEGLPNTDILTLVLDRGTPSFVYAGTKNGAFKSMDGGETWNSVGSDLPMVPIRALAIDPLRPWVIYAAAEQIGVFKSGDVGLTWRPVNTGFPNGVTIQSLAIDPVNSDTIYAGNDVPTRVAHAQVFKSTDGGGTWQDIWLPPSSRILAQTIYALVIDPSNPVVIYAATVNPDDLVSDQPGAFKSNDGGQTWTGLVGLWGPEHRYLRSMAIDPIHTSNLYATSTYGYFWNTTNAGTNWKAVTSKWTNAIIAIDPSNPSTIYVGDGAGTGVFKSTDTGATWHSLGVH